MYNITLTLQNLRLVVRDKSMFMVTMDIGSKSLYNVQYYTNTAKLKISRNP